VGLDSACLLPDPYFHRRDMAGGIEATAVGCTGLV
jgi:hypothetical protein